MNFVEFVQEVARVSAKPQFKHYRIGQVAYSVLADNKPMLARQVSGTLNDPFYAHKRDDERLTRFYRFVSDNWDVEFK